MKNYFVCYYPWLFASAVHPKFLQQNQTLRLNQLRLFFLTMR